MLVRFIFALGKNFERNALVPNRCAASFVLFCPLLSTFRVARKLCPCCCFIFSKTQCHTENTTPSRVDRRNTRSYTQRKGMRKHKYRHRERSYGRARTRSRARCCAGTANSGKFPTGWTVDKLLAKGYMRCRCVLIHTLSCTMFSIYERKLPYPRPGLASTSRCAFLRPNRSAGWRTCRERGTPPWHRVTDKTSCDGIFPIAR